MAVTAGSSKLNAQVRRLAGGLGALLESPPEPQAPPLARQAQRRLGPDQIAQLIADYRAGRATKDLAKDYAISRDTVTQHVRRAGVPFHQRGLAEEQRAEAENLYLAGWSLQQLAERYVRDDETIRQDLKRRGVRMRKPWERVQPR